MHIEAKKGTKHHTNVVPEKNWKLWRGNNCNDCTFWMHVGTVSSKGVVGSVTGSIIWIHWQVIILQGVKKLRIDTENESHLKNVSVGKLVSSTSRSIIRWIEASTTLILRHYN
jgi:hypothetical protein